MTRYAVTGPVDITEGQAKTVQHVIQMLPLKPGDSLASGGAYGVDTVAARAALDRGFELRLVVPAASFNEALLKLRSDSPIRLDQAPPGADRSESYMRRNEQLVAGADVLLAFPLTPIERLRSGTWATIRRAHKAGVQVRLYPLNIDESQLLRRTP